MTSPNLESPQPQLNPVLAIFLETAEKARPTLIAEGLSPEEIRRDLAHQAFIIGSKIQQVADVNHQVGKEQGMTLAMQQLMQSGAMEALGGARKPQEQPPPAEQESSDDKGHGLYL